MKVEISERSNPPVRIGIYAFLCGEELVRVGSCETDLVARVIWRGTIVTEFHNGRPPKGFSKKEAARWLERLTACPEGTVWAREGTQFKSFLGTEIDGSLAEEREIIRRYHPYMNTARN